MVLEEAQEAIKECICKLFVSVLYVHHRNKLFFFFFSFIFLSMLRPSAVNRVSWIPSLQRATKLHFQRNVGDTVSWWIVSVLWPRTAVPTMARWETDAFSFAVQDRQHHHKCTFTVSPVIWLKTAAVAMAIPKDHPSLPSPLGTVCLGLLQRWDLFSPAIVCVPRVPMK